MKFLAYLSGIETIEREGRKNTATAFLAYLSGIETAFNKTAFWPVNAVFSVPIRN